MFYILVDGPDIKIPRTHATTPRPNTGGSSSITSRPWEWTTAKPSSTSRPSTAKPATTTQKVPSTSAPTVEPSSTVQPTTQPGTSFTCTKAGFSPDPTDPQK